MAITGRCVGPIAVFQRAHNREIQAELSYDNARALSGRKLKSDSAESAPPSYEREIKSPVPFPVAGLKSY
jgi:hypothetical protein